MLALPPLRIVVISHTDRALLGYGIPLAKDLGALDITKDIDALDITFVTRQGLWREHPLGAFTQLLMHTSIGLSLPDVERHQQERHDGAGQQQGAQVTSELDLAAHLVQPHRILEPS